MASAVVSPCGYAAEAGATILKKGGNAVDALAAGSIAQGVVNPLLCGLGGRGSINLFLADEKKNILCTSNAGLGSKMTPDSFEYYHDDEGFLNVLNDQNKIGYKSINTPDYLKIIFETQRQYGRLEWKECLQPGIKLAREGFKLDLYVSRFLNSYLQMLNSHKATAEIYTKNGLPYSVGDILVQKDYANTLEKIADHGADIFYKGEIADTIAKDFERHHAFITKKDLESIEMVERKPWTTLYHGYKVSTAAIEDRLIGLIQILNILEGFDLKKLGWNTPKYLDVLARAMNIAYADFFRYNRDPNFFPETEKNLEMLASKEYAAEMRAAIESGKDKDFPSAFEIIYGRKPTNVGDTSPNSPAGTTNICVLDEDGNAAGMIHSNNHSSGVVTPGIGVLYNNLVGGGGWMYQVVDGKIDYRPGKKMLAMMTPALVFKDDKIYMAIGSPNGNNGLCSWMQAMINVIDFGMGMQQAISTPRIEGIGYKKEIILRYGFPYPYPQKNLEELGHTIKQVGHGARVSGILINPETGEVEAGTDERGGGGLAFIP